MCYETAKRTHIFFFLDQIKPLDSGRKIFVRPVLTNRFYIVQKTRSHICFMFWYWQYPITTDCHWNIIHISNGLCTNACMCKSYENCDAGAYSYKQTGRPLFINEQLFIRISFKPINTHNKFKAQCVNLK